MENENTIQQMQEEKKDWRFSIEIGESAKKERYIKSIKIRADTKEELEQQLKDAKKIVEEEWI
ncbi:MAG: hypothetical protein AABY22_15625 [Nanoarchaeota archaeon]